MEEERLEEFKTKLNIYLIERMKENIEKVGSKKVWEIIESFANPNQRIRYRKLFYLAGGKR